MNKSGGAVPSRKSFLDQHHPGASRHPSSSEEGSLHADKARGYERSPMFSHHMPSQYSLPFGVRCTRVKARKQQIFFALRMVIEEAFEHGFLIQERND
jgi:hypothetical protein